MTLKLQVLGPGCCRCKLLAEFTEAAARELAYDYTMEKITDLNRIMAFQVIATPALVVNGAVALAGKVPGKEELETILKRAAEENVGNADPIQGN